MINRFKSWYEVSGHTVETLADALDASEQAVYKWLAGERRPKEDTMKLIYALSKGAVDANSFYLEQH